MNDIHDPEEMFVSVVPVEYIDGLMASIGHLTDRLVPHMDKLYTVESLEHSFKDGTMVPWVVVKKGVITAFLATEAFQCPRRKVLIIRFGAAQDMAECIDLVLDRLEDHARDNGCKSIEISGRLGWSRALDRHGFEPAYLTMSKEI
jgi:hypothetical protein